MNIPGYTYGDMKLAKSPVDMATFETMKHSVLFDDEDVKHLRMAHEILKDQTEAVLDVWYGFVGANPHLLISFTSQADGKPIMGYLEGVRRRFAQWIIDTTRAQYDQAWLDYQHEIGLRHHRSKKNQTDGVSSTAIVPFRDLFALIFPVSFTLRPFLGSRGHSAEQVDRMYNAWLKACLLQVTLWSHPYIKDGDF